MRQRIFIVLLALDHFVLALLTLGNCKHYEMISSAMWALEADGKLVGQMGRPTIDALAYLLGSKNHCSESYLWQSHLYKGAT